MTNNLDAHLFGSERGKGGEKVCDEMRAMEERHCEDRRRRGKREREEEKEEKGGGRNLAVRLVSLSFLSFVRLLFRWSCCCLFYLFLLLSFICICLGTVRCSVLVLRRRPAGANAQQEI